MMNSAKKQKCGRKKMDDKEKAVKQCITIKPWLTAMINETGEKRSQLIEKALIYYFNNK